MLCKTINIYCCFVFWTNLLCSNRNRVTILPFSKVPCVPAQQGQELPIVYLLVYLFPYPEDILRAETSQQFIFIRWSSSITSRAMKRGFVVEGPETINGPKQLESSLLLMCPPMGMLCSLSPRHSVDLLVC